MAQIILDFGSGNTSKNNKDYIKQMYDSLKEIDTGKHEIIVKWQLFKMAGPNIPLTDKSFQYAYDYGKKLGYKVTASVFDLESLGFLLNFKVPFIKIANNRMLDFLIDMIPNSIPVYISKSKDLFLPGIKNELTELWCVSQYPAKLEDYKKLGLKPGCNVSDHTSDFILFHEFKPAVIEWHFKLDYSTGLDAGTFARTPEQLKEIL